MPSPLSWSKFEHNLVSNRITSVPASTDISTTIYKHQPASCSPAVARAVETLGWLARPLAWSDPRPGRNRIYVRRDLGWPRRDGERRRLRARPPRQEGARIGAARAWTRPGLQPRRLPPHPPGVLRGSRLRPPRPPGLRVVGATGEGDEQGPDDALRRPDARAE